MAVITRAFMILFVAICSSSIASAQPNASAAEGREPSGTRLGTSASSTPKNLTWPEGTTLLRFENLEGVILVPATIHGESQRDTTGVLALDTGAGFLALDQPLVAWLGLFDPKATHEPLDFAERPLPRLEIGGLEMDQVSPVLTLDAEIVKQVADRPVLGLLGQRVLESRAVVIDYLAEQIALIPVPLDATDSVVNQGTDDQRSADGHDATKSGGEAPANLRASSDETKRIEASRGFLGKTLGSRAVAVPFRLLGDGKIVISSRVSNPKPPNYSDSLTLIVDTGATKCILFDETLRARAPEARRWASLRGLSAPTLIGPSEARLVMIPSIELTSFSGALKEPQALRQPNVDAAVIGGEMSAMLSRAVGEPVHGLLGYSFLKRYRVTLDYPHRVLWLDPLPKDWDGRHYE